MVLSTFDDIIILCPGQEVDPEPRGRSIRGAAGEGERSELLVIQLPVRTSLVDALLLCLFPIMLCSLPATRVTLERCLKELYSGTSYQWLLKPVKKIYHRS